MMAPINFSHPMLISADVIRGRKMTG